MSTTASSPSPSPEPIDISTPPPPSESPPPLPVGPPPLLSHIQGGPTALTLEEHISDPGEIPVLTLEEINAALSELMHELGERSRSLSHSTDGSGRGPKPRDYSPGYAIPTDFEEKVVAGIPITFASIMIIVITFIMSMHNKKIPTLLT
ncbi:hypothetical protein EI94DRAFT_1806880 [Lactarius quietus]|nr:hypothetical protein EI94DRAFT_1806880 [Lactarius quietus]